LAAAGRLSEPVLAGVGLFKRYRSRGSEVVALAGVDLALGPESTVGLVGESGCGKSTLVRVLTGLERPDRGVVRYRGTPLGKLDRHGRRDFHREVGLVLQDPLGSLNPRRTVAATLKEALALRGGGRGGERRERARALLELVGLGSEHLDRYPGELSGGQRQRVALARALAGGPQLLLADEPFKGLDPTVQSQLLELLARRTAAQGVGLLLVAHDLAAVGKLCRRLAVMYLGAVVEEGPSELVLADPRHPYTAALLAASGGGAGITLAGFPPAEGMPPRGCPLHPRCPRAGERCALEEPGFSEEDGRRFRCHHPLGGKA